VNLESEANPLPIWDLENDRFKNTWKWNTDMNKTQQDKGNGSDYKTFALRADGEMLNIVEYQKDDNSSTQGIFWIDKPTKIFMGIIKKPDARSSRDHHFLFGGVPTSAEARSEFMKIGNNGLVFTGAFIGQVDSGLFLAFWAGSDTVQFRLKFNNLPSDTKQKIFLAIDPYNKLEMKYEYSDYMPFIGIEDEGLIKAHLFPPPIKNIAYNSATYHERPNAE
jgi:hypothetical protein